MVMPCEGEEVSVSAEVLSLELQVHCGFPTGCRLSTHMYDSGRESNKENNGQDSRAKVLAILGQLLERQLCIVDS